MAKFPRVNELDHRIALCTMHDVVEKNGVMVLKRTAVARIWARIISRQTLANNFLSPDGFSIMEQVKRTTFFITFRHRVEVELTSAAWVYEEFRKSPPRWYKVVGFTEIPEWTTIHAHLYERSGKVEKPVTVLSPQPNPVQI